MSSIYGFITYCRNTFYDFGILKSYSFGLPIICVGNINVGGTGKTPHTEMLIEELYKEYNIACLSRGYKRKSKGFILSNENSTVAEVGDEPLQIKKKYPQIIVACDENRVNGVNQLLKLENKPNLIILDDAFQHRQIKAGKNIIIIDYNKPLNEDYLLPLGRLRESTEGLKRADYIIVSKCPPSVSRITRRVYIHNLKLKPYQKLFFTTMEYSDIYNIEGHSTDLNIKDEDSILCITGIAVPQPYVTYLNSMTRNITHLSYPDHHNFTKKEIDDIIEKFSKLGGLHKYIFTTEKDIMRLKEYNFPDCIKQAMYYIPIKPKFIFNPDSFINDIKKYVRKS